MIQVVLLAFALAMDAFSVSISYGVCQPTAKFSSCLRIPFFTGLFQFFMPILGWFIGKLIGGVFLEYGNWIACAIFIIIGIKMIIDSIIKKNICETVDISKGRSLIFLSIATSIDAFAAGLSLGILKTPLIISAGMIGGITFLVSLSGIYLGRFAGFFLGKWGEIVGGIILISLGINIIINNLAIN